MNSVTGLGKIYISVTSEELWLPNLSQKYSPRRCQLCLWKLGLNLSCVISAKWLSKWMTATAWMGDWGSPNWIVYNVYYSNKWGCEDNTCITLPMCAKAFIQTDFAIPGIPPAPTRRSFCKLKFLSQVLFLALEGEKNPSFDRRV